MCISEIEGWRELALFLMMPSFTSDGGLSSRWKVDVARSAMWKDQVADWKEILKANSSEASAWKKVLGEMEYNPKIWLS